MGQSKPKCLKVALAVSYVCENLLETLPSIPSQPKYLHLNPSGQYDAQFMPSVTSFLVYKKSLIIQMACKKKKRFD